MAQKVIINGAAGRMGQTLVACALGDRELELAGVIERVGKKGELCRIIGEDCPVAATAEDLLPASGAVVVDFTLPAVSVALAEACAKTKTPLVIGTTGLTADEQARLNELAAETPLFWAPNMSVGVNVLLSLLPKLVEALGEAYDPEIMEIHHNKKADAPSGTALKLAECLAEARKWKLDEVGCMCREGIIGPRAKDELGVQTIRGGDVVGDHTVYFLGPGERIEVTHRAHSRETFAQGALRAAKWLADKPANKLYTMADIFA